MSSTSRVGWDKTTIVAEPAHIVFESYCSESKLDFQWLEFPVEAAWKPKSVEALMGPQHVHGVRLNNKGDVPRIQSGIFRRCDDVVEGHTRDRQEGRFAGDAEGTGRKKHQLAVLRIEEQVPCTGRPGRLDLHRDPVHEVESGGKIELRSSQRIDSDRIDSRHGPSLLENVLSATAQTQD